jgi:hypothetical protein
MSVDEDYFIPVRGGAAGTKIENLPGGSYTGDIDDVKYLRDKLFSALKIPASYLTQGDEGSEDKTTLAQKDIRFARTITRLQRNITSELEKIAVIHLYTLGYTGKDLISFKLQLNQPSKISELQELEHWKAKFDIASAATEGYFSRRWVSKNIFGLSDDEILRSQREMFYDRKLDASLEGVATVEADAAAGGGGDSLLGGGDTGGGLLGGDEPAADTATDTATDTPAADAGDEDESVLLKTPGKREEYYTTPGAKGKMYKPVKVDKRNQGSRTRSYRSHYSDETGRNTFRNVFKGASELNQLARGIYENVETNYEKKFEKEENKILENDVEIQKIIENLEKRDAKNDEV